MSDGTLRFWNRPLGKGVRLVLLFVVLGWVAFYEIRLGRKRLFVDHDWHYAVAFVMFWLFEVILAKTIMVVAAKTKIIENEVRRDLLQASVGVLSFTAMVLFLLFNDYSASRLDTASAVDDVGISLILGALNTYGMNKQVGTGDA